MIQMILIFSFVRGLSLEDGVQPLTDFTATL